MRERERERERERGRESVCICACVRIHPKRCFVCDREKERERERVCVCVCVRAYVCVCACLRVCAYTPNGVLFVTFSTPLSRWATQHDHQQAHEHEDKRTNYKRR